MTEISGYCAPAFEPVRDAFEQNFADDLELGAGFAAMIDGECVVDLHGGWRDRKKTIAWDADTLVPVYSTTKGIAALVLGRVLARSNYDYDTPVAEVWPDFGRAGKEAVTIGQVIAHQAGLPGFVEEIDPALWLDPPACADALALLAPIWEPGTAHGYHPLSWGYLVGEIVKRVDGRSLGTVLREDICEPLGIDFHVGLGAEHHDRCADIMRPRALPDLGDINAATRAAFLTKWAAPDRGGAIWREIEIPSANGHGGALAAASLYGAYAHGGRIGDLEIIAPETFAEVIRRRALGQDLVLPFITEFAAGVMRNNLGIYGPNPDTLAHSGWGGSMALGDPDRGLSLAYVMNRQSNHLQGDPRARRLVEAVHGCL